MRLLVFWKETAIHKSKSAMMPNLKRAKLGLAYLGLFCSLFLRLGKDVKLTKHTPARVLRRHFLIEMQRAKAEPLIAASGTDWIGAIILRGPPATRHKRLLP